jgi:hypothetical protein
MLPQAKSAAWECQQRNCVPPKPIAYRSRCSCRTLTIQCFMVLVFSREARKDERIRRKGTMLPQAIGAQAPK